MSRLIIQKVENILKQAFLLDISEIYGHRNFSVVVKNNERYEIHEGTLSAEALTTINDNPVNSRAGFICAEDWGKIPVQDFGDVLILNQKLLDDENSKCLDSMIIHELCHLVIESQILQETFISNQDRVLGHILYNRTDKENELVTRHDKEFCNVFAAAARNLLKDGDTYLDVWDVLQYGMRYDVFEWPRCSDEIENLESEQNTRNTMQTLIVELFDLMNDVELLPKAESRLQLLKSQWATLNQGEK